MFIRILGKEKEKDVRRKKGKRGGKKGPFISNNESQEPNISYQRKLICHLESIKNFRVSV